MAERPKSKPTRWVGYLRVSTRTQAHDGGGLEVQRATIEELALIHGAKVVGWYADEGVSGTAEHLGERYGWAAAMKALETADAIAVYRLDRIARDMVTQEQLLGEVWRFGREVVSCSSEETRVCARDGAGVDATRDLIRHVLGAVAQYERAMIRLRLSAGIERKRQAGGYVSGAVPYGFQSVKGELVPLAREQEGIALAKRLRSEGASLRAVARAMDEAGYPSKRGKAWWPATVAAMLGEAYYGKATGENRIAAEAKMRAAF